MRRRERVVDVAARIGSRWAQKTNGPAGSIYRIVVYPGTFPRVVPTGGLRDRRRDAL